MVHLISYSKIVPFCWDKWRQTGGRHKWQVIKRGWDSSSIIILFWKVKKGESSLLGQSSTILIKIQENFDRNAWNVQVHTGQCNGVWTVYIKQIQWETSVENKRGLQSVAPLVL